MKEYHEKAASKRPVLTFCVCVVISLREAEIRQHVCAFGISLSLEKAIHFPSLTPQKIFLFCQGEEDNS